MFGNLDAVPTTKPFREGSQGPQIDSPNGLEISGIIGEPATGLQEDLPWLKPDWKFGATRA